MSKINLEKLAGEEYFDFIEKSEATLAKKVISVEIRDTRLRYFVESKRALWQALGLEYIEPELLDWIDTIPKGSIYYDLGASNGIFAIYAAVTGLKVLSFEPEAQNFALLEKNNFLNSDNCEHPMKTFQLALSSATEMGNIYIAKYEASGHMKILDKPRLVQEKKEFLPEYIQNVMKYSLDELSDKFSLPKPEYIKIDVDGAEFDLLQGAKNILASSELKGIFIELDATHEKTAIIEKILESHSFVLKTKVQVQDYENLHNAIYSREEKS